MVTMDERFLRNDEARRFFALGALFALLAVAGGAFGAHALRARLDPQMLAVFETGVRYQFMHAFGLFVAAAACLLNSSGSRLPSLAGWLFVAGIVLFSGSLYLLSVAGLRGLGIVTPFGGAAFIAGWACLVVWVIRLPVSRS